MRKRVMKLAAAALILAMSASVIPTGAGKAEAKSAQVSAVTEDEKEALKTIMKENREYLFNLTDNHNVAIMNYQVAEPAKLAEV